MHDDEDETEEEETSDVITTANVPLKGRQAQGFTDHQVKGFN